MPRSETMAFIQKIHTVAAPYRVAQGKGIAWLMRALQRHENSEDTSKALNLYERLLSNESIAFRASVLSDYTHDSWESMTLFKESRRADGSVSPWNAPPLQDRMRIFMGAAQSMARQAFADTLQAPRYIIDISCTGYQAPYPVQMLTLEKAWENDSRLLKIGHMGCYASIPALHMAAQLSRSIERDEIVTVLSTELCSLHLDPLGTHVDQIVSNILFADGCARIDIGRSAKADSLGLFGHYEVLVPDCSQDMAWELQDSRFHMSLSRKVVVQLKKVIDRHLSAFLESQGINRDRISRYAIHPGGPRIVESIQEELGLDEESVRHSKHVLKMHGNMSSATIPHVWKEMQEDPHVKAGEFIVSMAFGPGLTLTMNLLQKS